MSKMGSCCLRFWISQLPISSSQWPIQFNLSIQIKSNQFNSIQFNPIRFVDFAQSDWPVGANRAKDWEAKVTS